MSYSHNISSETEENRGLKDTTNEEIREPIKPKQKFFNRMDKLGDLFFLNLRFTVSCLPLITIGAAFTALYSVTNKMIDDKEGNVGKEYWKAFKNNFTEATGAWIINLLYIAFMYYQYNYMISHDNQFSKLLFIVLGFEFVFLCIELPLLFPMIARYKNKIINQIINSTVFAFLNLGIWFRMFFLWVVPLVLYYLVPTLFVYTWYMWFLILTAIWAYVCSIFLKNFYAKLETEHNGNDNKGEIEIEDGNEQ